MLIAVHDGVRPLVSSDLILETVECAAAHGTAIPVVEAVDSLRQLTPDGSHPIDRNTLRIVQTPQVFDAELLRRAYELDYSPTSPTTPRSSNGRDMRSRSATESAAT